MHAANPSLNSVSRRTRSRWEAFYRSKYDEINNKYDQEQHGTPNYDAENRDFETKKERFVEKGARKKNPDTRNTQDSEDSEKNSDDEDDIISDDYDSDEKDYKLKKSCKRYKGTGKVGGTAKKKKTGVNIKASDDMINMLVDSLWKEKDLITKKPVCFEKNILVGETTLPKKFSLEFGKKSCSAGKTEWEKEIDSLFNYLEMGLWESEVVCEDSSMSDDDDCIITGVYETQASHCRRGDHDGVLDEQIGIVCKYCNALLLDIKYVLPDFYVESPEKRERKDTDQSQHSILNKIHFQGCTNSTSLKLSSIPSKGTVLELIPQSDKELHPHQLEGFQFLWRNIAGDINIKNLEKLPSNGGRGCIISHAPGTGKTRLTIVFLQTFMKLYPTCRPLIIAPRGMLLTWEQEFKKWEVDINFHNLNETKLSGQEAEVAASFGDQTRDCQKNKDYTRLTKLFAWMKGGGVLGIGYKLFEELAGEHEKKRCSKKFKNILLELPGLIVMDEGHTPRNSQSLMWKAVKKIKTQRRVILSGTPFQNNFSELYNTLCLVNPTFSQQIMKAGIGNPGRKRKMNDARDEWANLTSCINKKQNVVVDDDNDERLKKLRLMIEPFVHIHKGGILQKTLPGMRDCLVILKPTDLQTKLLENVPSRVDKFLQQDHFASLISIHPSLVAEKEEFSDHKRKLKSIESNHNAGVKTRFLINLIQLSIRLEEKVLVFSQFIDPLIHIKNLIKSHFSWKEGREIIYMHGDQNIKQRQCLINRFNEKHDSAKVLLASQRACCEGINLVGASRVVLLDVVWNPSAERQAISRAYRVGQEKMVYVYHLVTLMEVKKYEIQAEKERISELIFCAGGEGKVEANEKIVSEDKVLDAMIRNEGLCSVLRGLFISLRRVICE